MRRGSGRGALECVPVGGVGIRRNCTSNLSAAFTIAIRKDAKRSDLTSLLARRKGLHRLHRYCPHLSLNSLTPLRIQPDPVLDDALAVPLRLADQWRDARQDISPIACRSRLDLAGVDRVVVLSATE